MEWTKDPQAPHLPQFLSELLSHSPRLLGTLRQGCCKCPIRTVPLQVTYDGKKASLFDLLEDLDYDECLAKAQAIAGVTGKRPAGKMQAFVFLKPHAVRRAAHPSRLGVHFAPRRVRMHRSSSV